MLTGLVKIRVCRGYDRGDIGRLHCEPLSAFLCKTILLRCYAIYQRVSGNRPGLRRADAGTRRAALLGEAGVFLTGLSTIREHYLIRRNRPEFHILMVSHDEGAPCSPMAGAAHPGGSLVFLPAAVPGPQAGGEAWHTSWILLDDVPRWQHLHRLGHRIWQGRRGAALPPAQPDAGGIRSPLQPQLLSLLLALLERTLQGRCAARRSCGYRRCFGGWRHVWTSPGAWPCWPTRWPARCPHLHRLCQQVFGMGPMAWLTGLRMNKARQLLLYTNWPLAELAAGSDTATAPTLPTVFAA